MKRMIFLLTILVLAFPQVSHSAYGDCAFGECGSGGGGGSGDVTDVFDCASGNCASVTLSDTDLLDMSAVSVSSATEGLILPQHATDCSTAGTAEGQVCWEADADTLYIGDGATVTSITGGGGATTDGGSITYVTGLTDSFTIEGTTIAAPFYYNASTDILKVAGGLILSDGSLSSGTFTSETVDLDGITDPTRIFDIDNLVWIYNYPLQVAGTLNQIAFGNGETIDNATDDYIEFQGVSGSDNTDLRFDLDGTMSFIDSPTDSSIGIKEDALHVGLGLDNDIYYYAHNGDANLPNLRYSSSGSKWQYSNDGTTWSDIGSGGGGGTGFINLDAMSFLVSGTFADGDAVINSQGSAHSLDFPAAADSEAAYQIFVPSSYSSALTIRGNISSSGAETTDTCGMEFLVKCISSGDSESLFVDTGFDTVNDPGGLAVSDTADYPTAFSDVLSNNDSMADYDSCILQILRDIDDDDTVAGVCQLSNMVLEWTE